MALKNLFNIRKQIPVVVAYLIPFVLYAVWVFTDLPGWLNQILRALGSDIMVLPAESATLLVVSSFVAYGVLTSLAVALHRRFGLVIWGEFSKGV